MRRNPAPRPWLACLLSLVWPGLGQLYERRWGRGAVLLIGQLLNLVLVFEVIGLFTVPAVWLWGAYDAYQGALSTGASAQGA